MQKAIFMHSIHYKNLHSAFSEYCHPPKHRYSTRYVTSENYVLPCSRTNRGQGSIKFSGPKTWANIPNSLKERTLKDSQRKKPFSKKLKDHILSTIYVDMAQEPTAIHSESITINEHIMEELKYYLKQMTQTKCSMALMTMIVSI